MIKLSNGHKIPSLGLGTFLMNDDNETMEVIKNALKVGYRHFDTAQAYYNEHVIGEALSESGLKREEYFITTKLQNHHSKEETRRLINESLVKLKTHYIDLLLIHWPNHDNLINVQTWEVFEEFYEKGIVKAIGVSNFTRFQLIELMSKTKIVPHVNQVEFHPLLSQVPLIKFLNEHNIKLMGYGPLMRGKMNEEPIKTTLEEIAIKYNVSSPEILIAWGLQKGAIMIPKTVHLDRLLSNYKTKNIVLNEKDIEIIDKINTGRRLYADPSNNVYGKYIK